jgi:hypothetical protein
MDPWLTLDDLSHACRVERTAIVEWVELGVVHAQGATPADWRFAAADLERANRVARLARELDLPPFAAALVNDLVDDRDRLRRRVHALERLLSD